MDSLGGESLARPLGCGEVGPIELPDQVVRARPRTLPGGKWAALGAFAILGTTAILVVSSPSGSSASGSVGKVWQDERPDEPRAEPIDRDDIYAVRIEGLPTLGRSDAKVTLVAVHEYGRPWSERTHDVIASLRAAYGAELRIVFKPYASSEASMPRLAGACAASLQGELAAFDDAVSRRPTAGLDNDGVFKLARELSLDMTRFASAMRRCEQIVKASTAELAGYGFTEQTYFVNGKLVDPWGLESIATFETSIDRELATAKRRIAAGASADRYYQQFVLDAGKTAR